MRIIVKMNAIDKLIEEFNGRFTSGNSIPVDRIWLSREMWERIRGVMQQASDSLTTDIHTNSKDESWFSSEPCVTDESNDEFNSLRGSIGVG